MSVNLNLYIEEVRQKIDYLQYIIQHTVCHEERYYCHGMLQYYLSYLSHLIQLRNKEQINKKGFTLEELASCNGQNGNPAYLAVNQVVYDLSEEPKWFGSNKLMMYAGKSLDNDFMGCQQESLNILKSLPVVGHVITADGDII